MCSMRNFSTKNISVFQLSTYRHEQLRCLAGEIASEHAALQSEIDGEELYVYASQVFDFGVTVGEIRATVSSKCERLKCSDFWFKQLVKISSRARETIAVRSQVVGASQLYCSDETFDFYHERQALRGYKARKNLQDSLEQAANQNYLMAKAVACHAFKSNYISVFITLGLDGRYHSSSANYQGKSFENGYAELSRMLKALLQYLSKFGIRGVDFYGVRCVEVHADGCPHFHVNLFVRHDLLPLLIEKLRETHHKHSAEMGECFDKFKDKIVQIRSRGSLEDYCRSIAYIFKNSYAGRSKDRNKLIGALRQKAVISVYGKHQYELVGMSGKSELIKELSRRIKVDQMLKDLGFTAGADGQRASWFKVIGAMLFNASDKYSLVKAVAHNRYGEPVERVVDIVTMSNGRWAWGDYFLIILTVICNGSRYKSWLRAWSGKYASVDRISPNNIRAPPDLLVDAQVLGPIRLV